MKKTSIILLLCSSLLLPSVAGVSAAPTSRLDVDFVGGGVIRGDLGPASGGAFRAARVALDRQAGRLGVDAATFGFETVRRSIVGTHVRGRQFHDGLPIEATSAAVHIVRGRVWQVEARGVALGGGRAPSSIGRARALSAALASVGVQVAGRPPVVERLLARRDGRLVDVWRVTVFSFTPAVAAEIDVAAADGRVLAIRDSAQHADGTATVFDPNPIVTSKNAGLRQPGVDEAGIDTDLDSPEQTAELKTLPIKEYSDVEIARGKLVGPWVNVQGPAPLDVDGTFNYTKMDPRFETAMAYAHLDRLQRYFQAMGFTGDAGVNAESQDVYTLPIVGFDNSFYQPGNDLIAFGAGGVDDAEDAEVIVHEYGHAIHHAQVPGWGARHEGGAMGEGWGDFLAGAYYAGSISQGFGDLCIADWDATSYSSANPPCLRRLDSTKVYPKDMTNSSVHADGELWSAFLWRLRDKLGCATTPETPECLNPAHTESQVKSDRIIKLVLTSHELLSTTADFGDAVAALRTAAGALERPEWAPLVNEAAAVTNMPLN